LGELTPKELRKRWRTGKDLNVALESAPNPAWREREWVIELLSFVLSDRTVELKGMPLALLADGRLHTFGHSVGNITFIASDLQLEIFAPYPHWFLDREVVERCSLGEHPAASVLRMKSEHVLANLNKFLAVDQDGVAWDPHGEQLPNAPWLVSVFKYLAEERALASDADLNVFKKLALVPDQFGQLSRPGLRSTPLWPISDRARRSQLRKVLDALGVPLVKGAPGLARALRAALAHAKSPLVGDVSGPQLVDAIAETFQ
jgi:sacsin